VNIAYIVACDDFFEIEVSDLRPALGAARGGFVPGTRLSTRLRARRCVASLLAMALLVLNLVPGARMSLPGVPMESPVYARSAARPDLPDVSSIQQHLWRRTPQASNVLENDACPTFPGHPKCVP
jgi:hypothetical protein